MKLRWENFKGMVPRMSPRLLPVGACEVATNVDAFSGELRPFGGLSFQGRATKGAAVRTIYLYDEKYWLNWLTDVHVVRGLAADDSLKRIYWTGDGAPKKASFGVVVPDPNGDLPGGSYKMGVAAPTLAPTLVITSPGSVYVETRAYLYTYVTSWGEESAPSPASATIDVNEGDNVYVNGLPTSAPTGYPTVTSKRIYRTAVGSTGATYNFVAEVDISVDSFPDIVETTDLGVALPSLSYDEPPDDLAGLISVANGIFAGFSGKQVLMCEPFQPHAWPTDYRYTVDYDIVGLAAIGTSIVVLTTGYPYVFTVRQPSDVTQERVQSKQPCISARSIAPISSARYNYTIYGVAYASPDGMFVIQPGTAAVETKAFMVRKDWQDLNPSTMIGTVHDDRYVGFHLDGGGPAYTGFMFDPPESLLVNLDYDVAAICTDLQQDKLYLLIDGDIYSFDESDLYREEYVAKTGMQVTDKPVNFGAMAVYADYGDLLTAAEAAAYAAAIVVVNAANAALYADLTWDEGAIGGAQIGFLPISGDEFQDTIAAPTRSLQVTLYADDVAKLTRQVTSEDPFRLPSGFLAREWAVEVQGHIATKRIELAQQAGEL